MKWLKDNLELKKNSNYLGIYKFKLLKNLSKKKVVALGGINKFNKKKLNF